MTKTASTASPRPPLPESSFDAGRARARASRNSTRQGGSPVVVAAVRDAPDQGEVHGRADPQHGHQRQGVHLRLVQHDTHPPGGPSPGMPMRLLMTYTTPISSAATSSFVNIGLPPG